MEFLIEAEVELPFQFFPLEIIQLICMDLSGKKSLLFK
jgi:hypothetical protein